MSTIDTPHIESTDLEQQVEQLTDLVGSLLDRIEDLEGELAEYREQNERDKADIRQYATEKAEETQTSDSNPEGREEENTTPETPIERCFENPDSSGIRITASVQRAMRIVGNFDRWAEKVGTSGNVVIKENLRKLLGTAGGEDILWKQVYRACRKLEELSDGALVFRKHRRHGWMIELKDREFLTRVVSGR